MANKKASAASILELINRIEQVAKKLEELCKCIYGNGAPGLKTEQTIVKTQMKIIMWALAVCIVGIVAPIVIAVISKIFHLPMVGG